MTRVGLLSDTHGYLDKKLISILRECDEIWHAGDFGTMAVYDVLVSLNKPVKAVYGNVDNHELRLVAPKELFWQVEEKFVFMTHIGGYPGRYPGPIKNLLLEKKPDIFVCGHSHILKVIYDKQLNLLHLNPGAAGIEGFHSVRTALRFTIDSKELKNMDVIELGTRY